jgi:hypothetical protein
MATRSPTMRDPGYLVIQSDRLASSTPVAEIFMSEVQSRIAGSVAPDGGPFRFYGATCVFNLLECRLFNTPRDADRALESTTRCQAKSTKRDGSRAWRRAASD